MAGKTIKGITVELGGDATGLDKALSGVNKQSSSLQSELRAVERLLKLDPGNVVLVQQKQELLAESVGNTKDKLNTLEKAQEQVNRQFQEGKIDAEQYREFQRELEKTKASLASAEGELESFATQADDTREKSGKSGLEIAEAGAMAKESGEQAQQGAAGWSALSKGAAAAAAGVAAVGGAVATGFGYAVSVADDAKGAMNDFQAATGLTGEAADGFHESMKSIYNANFGESFEDIGEAMAVVQKNSRLVDPSKTEKLTKSAIGLRDTFGYDIQEQMRAVNQLIDQFGISGEEAFGLIAQGAQDGWLDKNGDMLDTINEYSVHFKQLGLDAVDMFNSLANGAYSGTFSVDKCGDAIKEFGIRVKDGTADEAFTRLGLSADATTQSFAQGGDAAKEAFSKVTTQLFALEDPLLQNQLGVQLFGTMWEDLGAEGVAALADITGEFSTTSDAQQKINQVKYDTFGEAVTGLGRVLQTSFVLPIGEQALPIFNDFIGNLTAGAISADGDASKMAASVGDAISQMAGQMGEILPQIADFAISILSGLASGIAEALPVLVDQVMVILPGIISALLSQLPLLLEAAVQIIVSLANGIARAIPTLLPQITQVVLSIVNTLVASLPLLVQAGVQLLLALVQAIPVVVEQLIVALPTIIDTILTALLEALPLLLEAAISLFQALVEAIPVVIEALITALPTIIDTIITTLIEALPLLLDAAIELLMAIVDALPTIIRALVVELPRIIRTITSTLINNLPLLIQAAVQLFMGIIQAIPQITVELVKNMPLIISSIIEGLSAGIGQMAQMGLNLIKGLWQGISDAGKWLMDQISGFFGGVVDGIKKFFGIKSPSTLFRDEIGKNLALGVGEGFGRTMQDVSRQMQQALPTEFDTAANVHLTGGEGSAAGVGGKIVNLYLTITSPTPLSPYETARQLKLAAQTCAI